MIIRRNEVADWYTATGRRVPAEGGGPDPAKEEPDADDGMSRLLAESEESVRTQTVKSDVLAKGMVKADQWPSTSLALTRYISKEWEPKSAGKVRKDFIGNLVTEFLIEDCFSAAGRGHHSKTDGWLYDYHQNMKAPPTGLVRRLEERFAAWLKRRPFKDRSRLAMNPPSTQSAGVYEERIRRTREYFLIYLPACEDFLRSCEAPHEGIGPAETTAMMELLNVVRFAKAKKIFEAWKSAGGDARGSEKAARDRLNANLHKLSGIAHRRAMGAAARKSSHPGIERLRQTLIAEGLDDPFEKGLGIIRTAGNIRWSVAKRWGLVSMIEKSESNVFTVECPFCGKYFSTPFRTPEGSLVVCYECGLTLRFTSATT